MANKNIPDLASIGAIDRTADVLEVYDTSAATNTKATPNAILGITGAPLGTTDTQNVTNKTLDTTNTVTLKDTLFTIQDDGDLTKQAKFQLSGITAGTTRTYTLPNASSTLVDITTAQTLTNKTLTSPAINTATIANPTLTVDSISGFSSGTVVSVAGLSISSGVLNTNNSVKTTNVQDTAITPAKLQASSGTSWVWQTWSPTWTNLTIGNGTNTAKYVQIGKTIHLRLRLVMGTTTVVGTAPSFTLPANAHADYLFGGEYPIGVAILLDQGVAFYTGMVNVAGASTAKPITHNAAGTYTVKTDIALAVPGGWGSADEWYMTATYEIA